MLAPPNFDQYIEEGAPENYEGWKRHGAKVIGNLNRLSAFHSLMSIWNIWVMF